MHLHFAILFEMTNNRYNCIYIKVKVEINENLNFCGFRFLKNSCHAVFLMLIDWNKQYNFVLYEDHNEVINEISILLFLTFYLYQISNKLHFSIFALQLLSTKFHRIENAQGSSTQLIKFPKSLHSNFLYSKYTIKLFHWNVYIAFIDTGGGGGGGSNSTLTKCKQ